jgi:hypothetical protein
MIKQQKQQIIEKSFLLCKEVPDEQTDDQTTSCTGHEFGPNIL